LGWRQSLAGFAGTEGRTAKFNAVKRSGSYGEDEAAALRDLLFS